MCDCVVRVTDKVYRVLPTPFFFAKKSRESQRARPMCRNGLVFSWQTIIELDAFLTKSETLTMCAFTLQSACYLLNWHMLLLFPMIVFTNSHIHDVNWPDWTLHAMFWVFCLWSVHVAAIEVGMHVKFNLLWREESVQVATAVAVRGVWLRYFALDTHVFRFFQNCLWPDFSNSIFGELSVNHTFWRQYRGHSIQKCVSITCNSALFYTWYTHMLSDNSQIF